MTYQREKLWRVAEGEPATAEGCRAVLRAMRAHGRPMSLSLIASRVAPMSVRRVAACLSDLIVMQEEVSINDAELFELERR